MFAKLCELWREWRHQRYLEMAEEYGICRVDGCDEWLLPVAHGSGKCPVHYGVQPLREYFPEEIDT